eukprot:UN28423
MTLAPRSSQAVTLGNEEEHCATEGLINMDNLMELGNTPKNEATPLDATPQIPVEIPGSPKATTAGGVENIP